MEIKMLCKRKVLMFTNATVHHISNGKKAQKLSQSPHLASSWQPVNKVHSQFIQGLMLCITPALTHCKKESLLSLQDRLLPHVKRLWQLFREAITALGWCQKGIFVPDIVLGTIQGNYTGFLTSDMSETKTEMIPANRCNQIQIKYSCM